MTHALPAIHFSALLPVDGQHLRHRCLERHDDAASRSLLDMSMNEADDAEDVNCCKRWSIALTESMIDSSGVSPATKTLLMSSGNRLKLRTTRKRNTHRWTSHRQTTGEDAEGEDSDAVMNVKRGCNSMKRPMRVAAAAANIITGCKTNENNEMIRGRRHLIRVFTFSHNFFSWTNATLFLRYRVV